MGLNPGLGELFFFLLAFSSSFFISLFFSPLCTLSLSLCLLSGAPTCSTCHSEAKRDESMKNCSRSICEANKDLYNVRERGEEKNICLPHISVD